MVDDTSSFSPDSVPAIPQYIDPFSEFIRLTELLSATRPSPGLYRSGRSFSSWAAIVGDRRGFEPLLPADLEMRDYYRRAVFWTPMLLGAVHALIWQTIPRPLRRITLATQDGLADRASGLRVRVAVGLVESISGSIEYGVAIEASRPLLNRLVGSEPRALGATRMARRDRTVLLGSRLGRELAAFPVIPRRPSIEAEHQPLGYEGAMAASYVLYGPADEVGQLGCRHTLSSQVVGAPVRLNGRPEPSTVALVAPHQIDLAVVKDPHHMPGPDRRVQLWPAQWLPCEIAAPAPVRTRIVEVGNTWGIFGDPMMPADVDLEHAGEPGGSGSAVLDLSTGGLAAVYRGAISRAGTPLGRAVHIQQATEVLQVQFVQ